MDPTPTNPAPSTSVRRPRRRAFTLVEAAMASVVVALMLATSVSVATAARVREQKTIDRQRGLALAQTLMTEILDEAYVDPGALPLFGLEVNEIGQPRSAFDDVDDYNGLVESPPKYADGTPITGYSRWSRAVVVQWVTAANLTTVSATETNLKKITVTVRKNGAIVAEIYGLRSKAKDSM